MSLKNENFYTKLCILDIFNIFKQLKKTLWGGTVKTFPSEKCITPSF